MKFIIKLLALSITTSSFLFACNNDVKPRAVTSTASPQTTYPLKPLNCPVITKARERYRADTEYRWVTISLELNLGFDELLPDDCGGDLSKLWTDLKRHDEIIRRNNSQIERLHYITPFIQYFPVTQNELIVHLDQAIRDNGLNHLSQYNRSNLRDITTVIGEFRKLILDETPIYFSQKHAPSINEILLEYNLKMGNYNGGEKFSFCIVKWNNCTKYFPKTDAHSHSFDERFDIYFSGSGDYWKTKLISGNITSNK